MGGVLATGHRLFLLRVNGWEAAVLFVYGIK
ncbi:MAG: hypothetical protein JWR26_3147 [Pedosphaera sp.]|nr:hypothetical protein [Pedosphaera sp.]